MRSGKDIEELVRNVSVETNKKTDEAVFQSVQSKFDQAKQGKGGTTHKVGSTWALRASIAAAVIITAGLLIHNHNPARVEGPQIQDKVARTTTGPVIAVTGGRPMAKYEKVLASRYLVESITTDFDDSHTIELLQTHPAPLSEMTSGDFAWFEHFDHVQIVAQHNLELMEGMSLTRPWIEGYIARVRFTGVKSKTVRNVIEPRTWQSEPVEGHLTDWEIVRVLRGQWAEDVSQLSLFAHGEDELAWILQMPVGSEGIIVFRRVGAELYFVNGLHYAGDPDAADKLDADEAQISGTAPPDYGNMSPLGRSIQRGDIEEVKRLIEKEPDINARDNLGRTPLGYAAQSGNTELIKLLIDAGADVNTRGHDGWVPLIWASENGHLEAATLLVEMGTDVNAADDRGETPLIWAAWKGHVELASLLIEKGANVNEANVAGGIPGGIALHDAVYGGHKEMVELLVSAGADVNARSKNGKTPLGLAIDGRNEEITELLRKAGATDTGGDDAESEIRQDK
ncbi:MAG: ankyrin repeat domain-containing protein [Planctomycetota bacterium]|jgi:ankyrin repeat protein